MLTFAKPSYTFTVTGEPDEAYRLYLARKVRESTALFDRALSLPDHVPHGTPLDISVDDDIGDVVAGVAAQTHQDCLYIEMLWVATPMRCQGIGRRLIEMAEEFAYERGCTRVRVSTTYAVSFYEHLGFCISGRLQPFPAGYTHYWLTKSLTGVEACGCPTPA